MISVIIKCKGNRKYKIRKYKREKRKTRTRVDKRIVKICNYIIGK